jgi:iron complex transport system ATP-binding protein
VKIEVHGVHYRYDSKPVLQDVSLQLGCGDILGIVGPNGSGKSTMIKCMDRILRPQKGSVFIDGEEINGMDRNDLAKKMGYVPQRESSKFSITVFDAILMGRRPYLNWRPSEHDLKKVSEIISQLDLDEFAMREIGAISGGQRQKVLIARALAQEPDVILLDEPTSNLDLRHQLEVLNLIKEQAENGITSVVAIHDLNLAARYCDKFVMLKEGVIYAAGGAEVLHPKNIEPVYQVKVSAINNSGKMVIVPEYPI